MSSVPSFLIVETGKPVASMRRHGGFPHWIRVAAGLSEREVDTVDVEGGAALPDAGSYAGVIVTGSGAMVTEREAWSERSADWLHGAAHAGVPLLGICYGHQLIAHALGGEVGDNPRGREMGTFEIETTGAAEADPLFAGAGPRFLAQTFPVQRSTARADVAAHVGGAELGVELHAPDALAPAEGVMRLEWRLRQQRGALGQTKHALQVGLDPVALVAGVRAAPVARAVLQRFVRVARGFQRD